MKSIRQVLRGNLLIFTLGDVIRQLSMFITFPFFSLYVQALGGSNIDIGIVNSLRPLVALFIYPIAGYLSDHYSRVKIISITGYVTAFLWIFFIFAPDWRMLALGNMLMGLVTFYFPASNSLMADSLPPERRGTGFSLWMAIPSAVGILSPYLGGFLITLMGVQKAMRILYILTLFLALLIPTMNLRFLKEPTRDDPKNEKKGPFKVILDSYRDMFEILKWLPRNLKAFTVMLIMSFFFNYLSASYWVVYSVDQIGLSELQWGTVLLVAAIVNVVMLVPAGFVVDRVGVKRILTISLFLSTFPIMLFTYSRNFADAVLLFIAMTVTNSFLVSGAPAFMANSVPIEKRGRVMAALGQGMLFINTRGGTGGPGLGAILTIPSILGSVLGGYVYDYNPALPWILLGLSLGASAVINLIFVPSPQKEKNVRAT